MRSGRLGVTVLSVGALLIGGLLFAGSLRTPLAAVPPSAGFELGEAKSGIAIHRHGPVLTVEGRICNLSGRPGSPPPVAIRVGGAGGFKRSFTPGASVLRPGASLFFHSTLALPSATSGPVAVSLERTAEGVSVLK